MVRDQALVLERAREWRVRALPRPVPGAGEVVVEPVYVGLCGTDLTIVDGRHPRARPPLILGHEILGAGPIGLLTGMVARAAGARKVLLVEPVPVRREMAGRLGFQTADQDGMVPDALGGEPADVVFDAAGVPASALAATRLVRPRGTIVIEAIHGRPAVVDLVAVTFAEITVRGARVYRAADIGQALQLLAAGSVDVTPLVSEIIGLDDVPAAMGRLERGESVKVLTAIRHEGA